MSKIAGLLCVVGMSVSAANAGTASIQGLGDLDPSTPNVLDVLPGSTQMIVGVGTATGTFDAVSLLIGSNEPGLNMSFAYNFQPLDTTLPPPPPAPFFIYPSDLFVGGNRFAQPQWTAPLQVGTLTIDTSNTALFTQGKTFDVMISAEQESQRAGVGVSNVALGAGLPEDLNNGFITVHIVPEPATIGLLGLASLAMFRRRKVA